MAQADILEAEAINPTLRYVMITVGTLIFISETLKRYVFVVARNYQLIIIIF